MCSEVAVQSQFPRYTNGCPNLVPRKVHPEVVQVPLTLATRVRRGHVAIKQLWQGSPGHTG